ncbi:hypothetical protein K504DRAFT_537031 [Pleomassaria siparia CBS 279.74]|uniref:Amino acid permease/ SLC12A domain-containing protein n=1 Tax=Pleomassaria siparia CBS 279.74 TaxID=1314801 RepID=A0A6G1JXU7_9PLEO|nr:hypothetical protein K504DRAFT_537031 [Pleomassaria siparia CBS 279.74]
MSCTEQNWENELLERPRVLYVWVFAGFSFYFSAELIVVTGGEMRNSRKNLPIASRHFFYRLVFFYLLGSLAISVICASNAKDLISRAGNANASPFVVAIKSAGISRLPSVVNAGILTSAWSAGNSYLYMSSRSLYSLAIAGQAPKIFTRCNRYGLPSYAGMAASCFAFLAYLSVGSQSGVVFNWFISLTNTAGYTSWMVCCIILIQFRKACNVQGVTVPYRSKIQPYAAWVALFFFAFLLLANGFTVFYLGQLTTSGFVTTYLGIPIFVALWLGHKFTVGKKDPWISAPAEVDLVTNVGERVAEKHDLYKDIQFNTLIKSAHCNDTEHTWTFKDDGMNEYTTTFFISCIGFLSAPTLPAIPGIETFKGESFHTSRWPENLDISRDFAEPSIKSISVFQRTANWSAPLRNSDISFDQMDKHKTEYGAIFERCAKSPSGFLYEADPRKTADVTDDERLAFYEKLYSEPGFSKWLGVFSDRYTDRQANELYSKFIADKIRGRVHDPVVADSLIPKHHRFGTRRVPLESGYFEALNKPNVHLVDLRKTPASHITENSFVTKDGKAQELDVLIYATGFDPITGAFSAIERHAKDDRPLVASSDTKQGQRAIWLDHRPRTFLGLTERAMPNMFMVLGPHQPFGNAKRNIEHAVKVVSDLLQFCKDNNYTYVEPTQKAVDEWSEHVVECSKGAILTNEIDSWMTGVNTNVDGKTVRNVARYAGSVIEYRKRCEDCKVSGYQGLEFLK